MEQRIKILNEILNKPGKVYLYRAYGKNQLLYHFADSTSAKDLTGLLSRKEIVGILDGMITVLELQKADY